MYSSTILDLKNMKVSQVPAATVLLMVLLGEKTVWAPEPVWILWRAEKYLADFEDRTPTV
jgi:hypothetical protein